MRPPSQKPTKRRRRATTATALALAAMILPIPSSAVSETTHLYVDRDSVGGSCDDTRSRTDASSPATPWCSLETAVARAPAGSTVRVRRGNYPKLEINKVERQDFVTFEAEPGEDVTLQTVRTTRASHFRFKGFSMPGGFNVYFTSDHIELIGNDISGRPILVRPGTNITIADNRIHDVEPGPWPLGYGIWASGSGGGITGLTIRGNRFERLAFDAMFLSDVRDALIEANEVSGVRKAEGREEHADTLQILGGEAITVQGNYFHDNTHGIWAGRKPVRSLVIQNNVFARFKGFATQLSDVPGAKIVNNTYVDAGYGLALRNFDPNDEDKFQGTPTTDVIVANNILNAFMSPESYLAYEDHNLILSGARRGEHDISSAPAFLDPAGGDYRLAEGSPGVGAGTSEWAPARDRLGRVRGTEIDVGADGGAMPSSAEPSNPARPSPEEPPTVPADATAPLVRVSLARPRRVSRDGTIKLVVACNESCVARVTAVIARPCPSRNGARKIVRRGVVRMPSDGSSETRLTLGSLPGLARAFGKRSRARVELEAVAVDRSGNIATARRKTNVARPSSQLRPSCSRAG